MSEPNRPRPVPGPSTGGPPRPGPAPETSPAAAPATSHAPASQTSAGDRFGDLDQRPVGEHVDVFTAEHARLERELRTIDQL